MAVLCHSQRALRPWPAAFRRNLWFFSITAALAVHTAAPALSGVHHDNGNAPMFVQALSDQLENMRGSVRRNGFDKEAAVGVTCKAAENLIMCLFVVLVVLEHLWQRKVDADQALSSSDLEHGWSADGSFPRSITDTSLQRTDEDWETRSNISALSTNEEQSLPRPHDDSRNAAAASARRIAMAKITAQLHESIKAVVEIDGPRKWESSCVGAFSQIRRAVLHAANRPEAFERESINAVPVLRFLATFVECYPIRVKQASEVVSLLVSQPSWAAALPLSMLLHKGHAHPELQEAARAACMHLRGNQSSQKVSADAHVSTSNRGPLGSLGSRTTCMSRVSGSSTPILRERTSGLSTPILRQRSSGLSTPGMELDAVSRISCSSDHGPACQSDDRHAFTPSASMMVVLHVVYPSYAITPQAELGRIATFVGLLWCLGPMRWGRLVHMKHIGKCRLIQTTALCAVIIVALWGFADVLSCCIFPAAERPTAPRKVPRHFRELVQYLACCSSAKDNDPGAWTMWYVVCISAFASAFWQEFLFRGIYLGCLQAKMQFWSANLLVACLYALEHEPLDVSPTGVVGVRADSIAPLLVGSLWCGYVYHRCGNLAVTVLAHACVHACIIYLYALAPGSLCP